MRAFFYYRLHKKQTRRTKANINAINLRAVGNLTHIPVQGKSSTQPLL
jgi:hypothetical protein